MTLCNMKGVTCRYESTENNHFTLLQFISHQSVEDLFFQELKSQTFPSGVGEDQTRAKKESEYLSCYQRN